VLQLCSFARIFLPLWSSICAHDQLANEQLAHARYLLAAACPLRASGATFAASFGKKWSSLRKRAAPKLVRRLRLQLGACRVQLERRESGQRVVEVGGKKRGKSWAKVRNNSNV